MSAREIQDSLPYATQSVCPACVRVIEGQVFEEEGKVFLHKRCPDHGEFRDLLSSDAEFFLRLRRAHRDSPVPVEGPEGRKGRECPMACGLCGSHVSSPAMVNIDLTNRCNLSCPICFANANAAGRVCELTLDQVSRILERVAALRPYPPSCVQFAGGEPTLHPRFIEAVRRARSLGIGYIEVASNGLRFARSFEFCQAASEAGLGQVYLQFDGVTDEVYRRCRGRPLMEVKEKAIENIARANMRTVLVPTLVRGVNDDQVGEIIRFAIRHLDEVSAISWQPVAVTGRIDEAQRMAMRYTTADLARDIERQSGVAQMHRDWYPFSAVQPFIRLMEAVTGQRYPHYSCHPNCGCATYLVVDKKTGVATPLPQFVDIDDMMDRIDRIAGRIERHPWATRVSVMQAMRSLKNYFHAERAPEGWDFEAFAEFMRGFFTFAQEQADKATYMAGLRRQRFGTLLMASMHFQDAYNFELSRVQRCVVLYGAPDGRLYPFCTWNSGPCHRRRVEEQFAGPRRQEALAASTTAAPEADWEGNGSPDPEGVLSLPR